MERSFTFVHGPSGLDFGSATFEAEGLKLNGKPLGPNATAHLLGYMAQSLADTYAGVTKSKTEAEAKAAFAKRLNDLEADTVGVRSGGGGGVSDEVQARRNVMLAIFRANKVDVKDFKKADDWREKLDEKFDELYVAQDKAGKVKLDELCEVEVEKMEARRAEAAARKSAAAAIALGDLKL